MDTSVMFSLTYGLFVVTAREGDKDNGCITNTAAQVTDTPLRISLTVNKANYTHGMIERTGEFNVSILSEKASFDTFKHFGFQSGRDVDKFDGYTTAKRADNGIYYITEGTNAYISAKVVQSVDLGTHTMFIADVIGGEKLSDDPSTTYTYYQARSCGFQKGHFINHSNAGKNRRRLPRFLRTILTFLIISYIVQTPERRLTPSILEFFPPHSCTIF